MKSQIYTTTNAMMSFKWPTDMYADDDTAQVRQPNINDNDFHEGNCEHCFGVGYMNAYCGRCFRMEKCTFKNGKLINTNNPTFVQFTSINGRYLIYELIIKQVVEIW